MYISIEVISDSIFVAHFNIEVPSESSTNHVTLYIRDKCLNYYGCIVDEIFIHINGPGWRLLNKTDIIQNESLLRVHCRSALEHFLKSQLEFQSLHLLTNHSQK